MSLLFSSTGQPHDTLNFKLQTNEAIRLLIFPNFYIQKMSIILSTFIFIHYMLKSPSSR
jgi:hypothetical protein